ncbi:hypothetical protein BX600DRAFT_452117 [Xylariales sp. PMI_506]|nr:hypothetical protein BX600DRAFT_452117 [Xylariales sp. PMI_506]
MKDHKKSRHGCVQCKRRKVKCDETFPCCLRCSQRREQCSYLLTYHQEAAPSPTHSQLDRLSPSRPSTPGAGFDPYLLDMDLIHFYLTSTYTTMWGRQGGQAVWRDAVFQEALGCPALLHGLLATAAMHKLVLGERTSATTGADYHSAALRRQKETIEGMVVLLDSLDERSCGAIFSLSVLVSFWAFASRTLPPDLSVLSIQDITASAVQAASSSSSLVTPAPAVAGPALQSSIDQFIQLVRLVQPVRDIAVQGQHWLKTGRFSDLMRTPDIEGLPPLTEGVIAALDEVDTHLRAHPSMPRQFIDPKSRHCLRNMFRAAKSPDWAEILAGWPISLPRGFIDELRSREPAALTMLAYWAVCFHALDGRWWAAGWSQAIIDDVSASITGHWSKLVEWPKMYLQVIK